MMRRLLLLLLTGCIAWLVPPASADDAPVPENTMKAAYLYNFALLTEWPKSAERETSFRLCVFGSDELSRPLENLHGRMIDSRILRLQQVADAIEARQCNMLFVGDADYGRAGRLIEALRGQPILIVTDDSHLLRLGAMLLIQREAKRLAFEVNLEPAKRSQLRFSSKLLRLALRVNGE
jgi:hypothetical protein